MFFEPVTEGARIPIPGSFVEPIGPGTQAFRLTIPSRPEIVPLSKHRIVVRLPSGEEGISSEVLTISEK